MLPYTQYSLSTRARLNLAVLYLLTDGLTDSDFFSTIPQVASDFGDYAGGVYTSTVCGSLPLEVNHAVLAVGFDKTLATESLPYYIVKNSWGTDWGIDGYFYIELGKNMCGLADCASFPIAAKL